jgi:DNA replication factor GINS
MNLDELRSAQAKERRKDSLQHLRDAFYDDVAAYVADLRASRDRRAEQVENPFSDDDVRRLSDELETTEEVAKALYERRVGKVVKLASFAAADMSVDTEGMTTEERALFDDLVSRIRSNKSTVLATLTGDTPVDAAGESDTSATDTDTAAAEPTAEAHETTQTDGPADTTGSSRPDTPTAADATATSPDHDAESPSTETEPDVLAGAMGHATSDDPTSSGLPSDAAVNATSADEPASPDPTRGAGAGADAQTPDAPTPDAQTPDAQTPDAQTPDAPTPDAPPASDPVVDDRTDASTPEAGATQTDGGAAVAAATDDGVSTGRDARVDRETVRITRDVGAILGVDEREYELASDDVVTLPAANATPLVERDAAERIE